MNIIIQIEDDKYIFQSDGKIYSKKYKKYIGSKTIAGYIEVLLCYNNIKIKGLAHRIIYKKFFNEIPIDLQVDHINNNRSDNSINNLQLLTRKENMNKLSKYKNNKSGYVGVSYSKNTKKWAVDFPNYKQKRFVSLFSAIIYRKYIEYIEGRFNKINIIYKIKYFRHNLHVKNILI
jgi:hypothetical protein